MTFEAQIAAGIRYLDENEPGWDQIVNVDKLQMTWGDSCVLGQIDKVRGEDDSMARVVGKGYGHYLNTHDLSPSWAEAHGFLVTATDDEADWQSKKAQFNTEWKQAILRHRVESKEMVLV